MHSLIIALHTDFDYFVLLYNTFLFTVVVNNTEAPLCVKACLALRSTVNYQNLSPVKGVNSRLVFTLRCTA